MLILLGYLVVIGTVFGGYVMTGGHRWGTLVNLLNWSVIRRR
ncbi:flagellar motor protein MotA, partial [Salmonella enterica subsp. enterica serovar Enteritidis str. 50-5646]